MSGQFKGVGVFRLGRMVCYATIKLSWMGDSTPLPAYPRYPECIYYRGFRHCEIIIHAWLFFFEFMSRLFDHRFPGVFTVLYWKLRVSGHWPRFTPTWIDWHELPKESSRNPSLHLEIDIDPIRTIWSWNWMVRMRGNSLSSVLPTYWISFPTAWLGLFFYLP